MVAACLTISCCDFWRNRDRAIDFSSASVKRTHRNPPVAECRAVVGDVVFSRSSWSSTGLTPRKYLIFFSRNKSEFASSSEDSAAQTEGSNPLNAVLEGFHFSCQPPGKRLGSY